MQEFSQTRLMKAGEHLFREGEAGDALYIIERGEMEIVTGEDAPAGSGRRVLNVLGPGSLLGELAVIDRHPRSATAIARGDVVLTVISPQTVRARLAAADPFLRLLFLVVARHFRSEAQRDPDPITARLLRQVVRGGADEQQVLEQLRMAADLESALERDEFRLVFQPVVALPDGQVVGFEALLRWHSRARGLMMPERFIPVAEATALILPIGRWCLEEAVGALARLRAVAGRPLFMSVNIAARQLEDDGFLDAATTALRRHDLDPGDLHLEIVEHTLLDDRAAGPWLLRCRMLGLPVALDDFGSGYSSLRYLTRYPIDTLKIDRAFVSDICHDPKGANICRAMIELGRVLGMTVAAEGIETPAQAELLSRMGCDRGQGWLYRRAMPLQEALALIASGGA
jgi:EAL domain-containing protein (putative c-di-GMP-specific phosphodiesterase class I)